VVWNRGDGSYLNFCLPPLPLVGNRRLKLPQVNDDVLEARPRGGDARRDDLVEPVVAGVSCLELDARVENGRGTVLLRAVGLDVDVGAVGRAQQVPCIDVEGVGRSVAETPIAAGVGDGGC